MIQEKIDELLFSKGILVFPNRCWYLCYTVYKRLPKTIQKQLCMVEGKRHYWLKDTEGNIYDVYADAYDDDDCFDYTEINIYDLSKLTPSVEKEYRECFNSKTNKESFRQHPCTLKQLK